MRTRTGQQSQSLRAAMLGLAVVFAGGCVSRADIEDLKTSQKAMAVQVAQIAADLKARGAQPGGRPAGAVPPAAATPAPDKVYAVAVEDAPALGAADAWVTLVEFSDFECSFCRMASQTLTQLRERYGNDLRIVFKHNPLPFHSRAVPAALATECAREQDAFWPMHDKLFAGAGATALGDAQIEAYAKELKLELKKFKACLGGQKPRRRVEQDQGQARVFGARGTPNFFINGRFVSGAQKLEVFSQVIDDELQKAKKSNIGRADYYAKAILERGDKSI